MEKSAANLRGDLVSDFLIGPEACAVTYTIHPFWRYPIEYEVEYNKYLIVDEPSSLRLSLAG